MLERDKYLHLIRDYEHYQKEKEEEWYGKENGRYK
jgi:hypothetical protein